MNRTGWRLGRIGGVEIRMDPSMVLIVLLFTFNLWAAFSDRVRFPELSATTTGVLAVLTALLFFGSILAHELAHAGMFLARGIPVQGITLYMFGGATQASQPTRSPGDEFFVTVVGPVTNLALGALFLLPHALGWSVVPHGLRGMFGYLALTNLLLGGFNLLPGFPMDGGHLLLAAVWKLTGSRERGTVVAARVGQAVALALIGGGFVLTANGSGFDISPIWIILIGFMLLRGATATLADTGRRRVLASIRAGDVMSAPPPTIPAEMPLGEALPAYLEGHAGEAFPVMEGGHVVGFASLSTAAGGNLDLPVREAAADTRGTVEAAPEETMEKVLARLGRYSRGTVLVLDQGRLVGVIEPEDLSRYLKGQRRSPVGAPASSSGPDPVAGPNR